MKKLQKFALLGVLALAGTVSFTSCSSDDEPIVGPNGERPTVKTEFSISIPRSTAPATTRQSAAEVQKDETFKGMKDIVLIPFGAKPAANSQAIGDFLDIDATLSAFTSDKANAKVYKNVAVPLGTTNFLFYGVSSQEGTGALKVDNLAKANFNTPADVAFNPVPFVSSTVDYDTYNPNVKILNDIIDAFGTPTGANLQYLLAQLKTLTAGSGFMVGKVLADLKASLELITNTNVADYAIAQAVLAKIPATANTFPEDKNLPQGSAQLKVVDGKFADAAKDDNAAVPAYTKYVKPASLYYWVSSDLKAANVEVLDAALAALPAAQDHAAVTANWKTVTDDAKYTATSVTAATQSVAMVNQIQYGVGRLDSYITAAGAKLKDNMGSLSTESVDQDITAAFPVTGILIGGQKVAGWDFTPKGTDEFTIFDKTFDAAVTTGTTEVPVTNTLVLETAAKAVVSIGLELTNNTGEKFYGINGQIVPPGGKFYLFGKLIPKGGEGTENYTKPADADEGVDEAKVFQQDFVTEVHMTINDLKKAYNVIPDLSTPKLELGLSVDLKWKKGLTFSVTL